MSRFGNRLTTNQAVRSMSMRPVSREATIVVVEDEAVWSRAIEEVCDFLSVQVMHMTSADDLATTLRDRRPMAVIAGLEASEQDGCHVLKLVAAHDPDLPAMMVTGDDAVLMGAADAVAEVWGLTAVTQAPALPAIGEIVEFLFRAGQRGGCLGLMPA